MAELVTDGHSSEANEKHPKKGAGKLGKYKWYIVGALAVIAVLVFYFARKNGANSSAGSGSSAGAGSGIDSSTGLPYASEYGSFGGIGATGPSGPAGPAGPPGKQGKPGRRGPAGPEKKKHKPPEKGGHGGPVHKGSGGSHVTSNVPAHPAVRLASSHGTNTARASKVQPRRAA